MYTMVYSRIYFSGNQYLGENEARQCSIHHWICDWILNFFKIFNVLVFKISLCSECFILSFGWFPDVWIVCADISERSVCSILFIVCADISERSVCSILFIVCADISERSVCSIFIGCLHRLSRWNKVFRNVGTYNSDAGGIAQKKENNLSQC